VQRPLGDRHLIRVQNPIRLGELSEPQPDIAVVRDSSYAAAHSEAADVLLLLIEVADTTQEFDRDVKLPLYARHGISESRLIDVAARQLSIHREPAEGEYRRIHRPMMGETLHLLDPQGHDVRVADLFAD
jgi:Uma2 family endonuclease